MSYRGGPPGGGLEAKAVSCGVDQPGVVVRALHAGVEAQGLAGQLAAGEGAGVWQGAVGLALEDKRMGQRLCQSLDYM